MKQSTIIYNLFSPGCPLPKPLTLYLFKFVHRNVSWRISEIIRVDETCISLFLSIRYKECQLTGVTHRVLHVKHYTYGLRGPQNEIPEESPSPVSDTLFEVNLPGQNGLTGGMIRWDPTVVINISHSLSSGSLLK